MRPSTSPTPLLASSSSSSSLDKDDTTDQQPLLLYDSSDENDTSTNSLSFRIKCNSSRIHPTDYTVSNVALTSSVHKLKETVRAALGPNAKGRYLRLISNGRLLAPDGAPLSTFAPGLKDGDCLHAVLAAPGIRGGHQAAMARGTVGADGGSTSPSHGSLLVNNRISPTTSMRSGHHRGIGIGPTGLILPRSALSGAGNDDEEEEEDVEAGRERRGFDRLRATGLTRSEVSAIRLYFSRQVDRFIEQQDRLREMRREMRRRAASSPLEGEGGEQNNGTPSGGPRSNQGGSTSDGGEGGTSTSDDAEEESDPMARRLTMEDRWMELQGPNSEFRLNLNANNPLLMRPFLFRGADDDDPLGIPMGGGPGSGSVSPTAAMSRMSMMGTDRDFIWGFILGFFVGFIMLFWVWMPTVPHKQKLGILTGISFQLALNLLKSGGVDNVLD